MRVCVCVYTHIHKTKSRNNEGLSLEESIIVVKKKTLKKVAPGAELATVLGDGVCAQVLRSISLRTT